MRGRRTSCDIWRTIRCRRQAYGAPEPSRSVARCRLDRYTPRALDDGRGIRMRKVRMAGGALTALLLGAAMAPWQVGAVTCQEALAGKRYRCTVKAESGFVGDVCLQFVSPGTA